MNFKLLKNKIKQNWRWLILIILAIVFFIGASSFNYLTQEENFVKWISPDQTANYTFAKLYGQEGSLSFAEDYNLYTSDIMRPRSFRSDHGELKPVSFLGIILIYGKIASITSYKVLPYLTPFFAAIGILFFYLLIKKLFGRRNALISSFLLASFPPFIYYSAHSMFHNVLFTVLLVIGLYFCVLMVKAKKTTKSYINLLAAALAGGFIGLAIITRTSELLWIAPLLIILWFFYIKKIGFTNLIIFLLTLILSLLPLFYWNQILYSSPWYGGYPQMNQSIINISHASSDLIKSTFTGQTAYYKELLAKLKNNIFYFGFHPRHSLGMFYYYFINMFYWLFWPAFLGGIMFLQRWHKWKRRHWAYLVSFFVTSFILIFYYGSWSFHDNPDPSQFTIGNSYTRYWLPIYLASLPFASMFIIKLTKSIDHLIRNSVFTIKNKFAYPYLLFKNIKRKFSINALRTVIMMLIFFISAQFILIGSDEGLVFLAQKQKLAREQWRKVLNLTEHNSTIITRYHDKLLFPERKVIVGLFDDKNMVAEYANLANYLPVYYYNFTLPEKDFNYLNNRRLKEAGLQIKKVKKITQAFTLYRLYAE